MTLNYKFDAGNHIHLLQDQPLMGTSTIVKETMPPFLAKWGAQCAVDYIENESMWDGSLVSVKPQTLKEAVNAWSKVRKEKAEEGTDMHSALEDYVKICLGQDGVPVAYSGDVKIEKFAKWSQQYVERFVFAEKNTYSKELWVGGQVDCLALLKSGLLVVIDFKSSKEAYFNQFVQCAGYAYQLDESGYGDADGSNWRETEKLIGGLVVVPFGAEKLQPMLIENIAGYKGVFKALVEVYTHLKSFKENKGGTLLSY